MLIVTEKPMRSVEIASWYVDEYTDKSNKKVYKVVGVVSPRQRGRLVTRDSTVIKDIYMDEETITIYRNENLNNVVSCKHMMDLIASRGGNVFSIFMFYDWLRGQQEQGKEEVTVDAN